jgi:hypothetical protein
MQTIVFVTKPDTHCPISAFIHYQELRVSITYYSQGQPNAFRNAIKLCVTIEPRRSIEII